MQGSWRTTSAAIGAAVSALVLAGLAVFHGDAGSINWSEVVEALGIAFAAVIGFKARDNKVSSEEAGAKPTLPIGTSNGSGSGPVSEFLRR